LGAGDVVDGQADDAGGPLLVVWYAWTWPRREATP
jgi:hypothetical protein